MSDLIFEGIFKIIKYGAVINFDRPLLPFKCDAG